MDGDRLIASKNSPGYNLYRVKVFNSIFLKNHPSFKCKSYEENNDYEKVNMIDVSRVNGGGHQIFGYISTFNPILLDITRFWSKTIPQFKGKCEGVAKLAPT